MTDVVEAPGTFQGLNLGEMKTLLKRHGFDDADPLAAWLNAAMHDLEDEEDWPWLEAMPVTIELEPGENVLVLPEEALKIRAIRNVSDGGKLEYWNRTKFARELEEPLEVGLAQIFTIIDTNQIQVWRVPTVPTIFEVIYQAATPNLTDDSEYPVTSGKAWPVNACYPIVQRAAAMALQAEDEEERAKSSQEQYEKGLERLKKKFTNRHLGEADSVEDVMGYSDDTQGRYFR